MIEAHGLTKYYGDTCAVRDLDFSIQQGEVVGILGLNGAGKTTTLRILSCMLLPSSGSVTIDGLDVTEHPHAIRKKVGFLPEEPPLYREMTVEAFLRFAGELRGMSGAQVTARLPEVLDQTGIDKVRSQVIGNLSHGYRKRVGIAQALIHRPPVVILDEPISGLDPVQIVEMRKLIKRLRGQHTVLVSSHILPEISQTCDHLLVIQQGQLVAAGTEAELTGGMAGRHRVQALIRVDRERITRRMDRGNAEHPFRKPEPTDQPGAWARDFVEALAEVDECQLVHEDGELVELRVSAEDDFREVLTEALVTAGFGLLQIAPAYAELESVFIELTRHKEVAA